MIIKSEEWAQFKKAIMQFAQVFEEESNKIDFSIENDYDFVIYVKEVKVYPIFTKKENYKKVEYDFSNCEIDIRTLAFSIFMDAGRIEITLKKKNELKDA
jgi:hypothetical protein